MKDDSGNWMSGEEQARLVAEASEDAERVIREYGPLAPAVHAATAEVVAALLEAEESLRKQGVGFDEAMAIVIGAAKEAGRVLERAHRFTNRTIGS